MWGASRDHELTNFANLRQLDILDRVTIVSASLIDFRSVATVIKNALPDEIYNLAGQSSVALSFEQPAESAVNGTINILESMRLLGSAARFYNACSSECFGSTGEIAADEHTAFHPCSPYGVGKAAAHWLVSNYRDAYKMFACSGILFNHESPLRPERFVTQKIIRGPSTLRKAKRVSYPSATLRSSAIGDGRPNMSPQCGACSKPIVLTTS